MNSSNSNTIKSRISNIIENSKNLINILEYSTIIFILPLLGYIASNIYSSQASEDWYNSIRFYIPDITTQSSGLFVNSFFYLFLGVALSQLYSENLMSTSQTKSYIIWLIPIILLMIYISNPIMYQSQSILAPAIIYTISLILAFIVLYYIYSIKANGKIKFGWIVFIIWIIYLTIFYYTGGSGEGRQASLMGIEPQKHTIDTCSSVNVNPQETIITTTETTHEIST
ncbi:ORF MSV107 hypothetical protein [Melanoplus sanguinipes entomopoxvirus]|uniref:Uncharacterized protein n=1 Tax=Melanoplus sanguinipes entomopoxvirus TaxID=83191 RepID=Q9YVY5_MSEPV|nr:ORF MSV107 hypothetical protein [Melanoplus sanguinipes entomopoxvirus]AAC97653.1 ORF MSV107 hypothetical protein [Melanoplus sanguinipes entomopoxvirus 'O']